MVWICTNSRKSFNFIDPEPEQICIEDIACALSNICRFTGHLDEFYSVAQHSVLCSTVVPQKYAFEALMHDAAEAYCNDIAAPLKSILPDYKAVEARIDLAVRHRFNIPVRMSECVKHADLVLLATERRDFDMDDGTVWPILENIEPAHFLITPLNPRQARVLFITRFNELWEQHNAKA
ncbi:HD family hydrolase [Pantoea agglomerans]|jgi:5'-deoxynucleotidase YfbR-like HD superfamily hydrolase|uniref:HD family hydrolase n=1 Tax=Enterobacter agglomerans TaxID=549 RepID=UPI001302DB63|nr:HD family hydrolase [Pantoea agglomerans]MDK4215873.1 HD family hydrolase [Pantoea agglomerans]QGY57412.1 HD family hydrolase [Pantoea agglomerans]